MAYVFLVPDPALARITQGNRVLYQHNKVYAEQVARAHSDMSVVTISATNEAQVWDQTLAAYRLAASRAGTAGTLGILVGHGILGDNVQADLAPPEVLRATEQDVRSLARARGGTRTERQRRIVAIGDAIRARVERVDLYTCNVGQGAAAPFLDNLQETWRVSVRGLISRLVSTREGNGPVRMGLTMPGGGRSERWDDEIPPPEWWRRAQLVERVIDPSDFMSQKASDGFRQGGGRQNSNGPTKGAFRDARPL